MQFEKKCKVEKVIELISRINYPKCYREYGCIPWDMPRPLELMELPVCVNEHVEGFIDEMEDAEELKDCQCTDDCEHVDFKATMNSFEIVPEFFCNLYFDEVFA